MMPDRLYRQVFSGNASSIRGVRIKQRIRIVSNRLRKYVEFAEVELGLRVDEDVKFSDKLLSLLFTQFSTPRIDHRKHGDAAATDRFTPKPMLAVVRRTKRPHMFVFAGYKRVNPVGVFVRCDFVFDLRTTDRLCNPTTLANQALQLILVHRSVRVADRAPEHKHAQNGTQRDRQYSFHVEHRGTRFMSNVIDRPGLSVDVDVCGGGASIELEFP